MNPNPDEVPVPGLDATASSRWADLPRVASPWLHEEVARRMVERLDWFRAPPASWLHWEPVLGGMEAHGLLKARLPGARSHVEIAREASRSLLEAGAQPSSWWRLPWSRQGSRAVPSDAETRVGMLWANMQLHHAPQPQTLLRRWHHHLDVGGFLMFSCLGPDTLTELRAVYAQQGWPVPTHSFTDMHDWGDMLVGCGFAEPVMDMERIVLTYSSAAAMLDELRGFGRNLSDGRFPALRGRGWRQALEQAIERHGVRADDGRLRLTFEIIYGHAFKAAPREPRSDTQSVSVDEMRAMLRARRT